ncbi:5-formyltetrahydrofolate cyclo-ligase [Desulfurivibrio alkaliphilus]|uniref:5-formyltetrahydrofolate cyclo-ligase n=1 Tax=Desulfurivibrio alkaliphilus (strain DSM 19089 / UNIQEM U267 / AHT2) TaxID=589865 RepID=D6Z494_DESAT|nr:5-formyltetrahydrofolate cyclo-ligase [Desulfurivibrio alkaliphilus]ADH86369.1 5-formyltetrahydrofolate cyclo-ligase [Desulfurivibrio alkaliphilus AHT 2]
MPPNPDSSLTTPGAAKKALRSRYQALPAVLSGRLAQHLRSFEPYRRAQCVFVSPSPLLKQLRINLLLDGKALLMPAPSLHDGFYLLSPYTINFGRLAQAVSPKGMLQHGRKLATARLADLQVSLLVAEALAVDRRGTMLGDGKGFFDLAAAILAATGALAANVTVVAAAGDVAQNLPIEPWDVQADQRLDETGLTPCRPADKPGRWSIHWEQLPPVRIRRITPLWQIREQADR